MPVKRRSNCDGPIRGLHNCKRTKKMVTEAPKLLHNLHRIYPKCSAYVEETMKCVEESSHEQTCLLNTIPAAADPSDYRKAPSIDGPPSPVVASAMGELWPPSVRQPAPPAT